jgi:ribonuclease VapC
MVVDTSALMAVLLGEAEAERVVAVVGEADALHMSAATVAEALIVAGARGIGDEMSELIDGLGVNVEPLPLAAARRVASAYSLWGKGRHPDGLNFGDCFAYELAVRLDVPLLFVGDDFTRTDVRPAL